MPLKISILFILLAEWSRISLNICRKPCRSSTPYCELYWLPHSMREADALNPARIIGMKHKPCTHRHSSETCTSKVIKLGYIALCMCPGRPPPSTSTSIYLLWPTFPTNALEQFSIEILPVPVHHPTALSCSSSSVPMPGFASHNNRRRA